MSTILEIEQAIEALPPDQFQSLAEWMDQKRAEEVDRAFEAAIFAGSFDAMSARAIEDFVGGKHLPLDAFLDRP